MILNAQGNLYCIHISIKSLYLCFMSDIADGEQDGWNIDNNDNDDDDDDDLIFMREEEEEEEDDNVVKSNNSNSKRMKEDTDGDRSNGSAGKDAISGANKDYGHLFHFTTPKSECCSCLMHLF